MINLPTPTADVSREAAFDSITKKYVGFPGHVIELEFGYVDISKLNDGRRVPLLWFYETDTVHLLPEDIDQARRSIDEFERICRWWDTHDLRWAITLVGYKYIRNIMRGEA